MQTQKRLTKRQRRLLRQQSYTVENKFQLKRIVPLTKNQQLAFDAYADDKNLMLHGSAGTGKTFSAIYLGLKEVFTDQYQKVVLLRSIVPSRDIGFLPGSEKEKIKVYELPYQQICSELFGRGDAYDLLKFKQKIEFISTSFIRGVTIQNSVVIVDEIQNCNFQELRTIITRIGNGSRVIFCGDYRQTDLLKSRHDVSGINRFLDIINTMKGFAHVEFTTNDIVRSNLVRDWIVAEEAYDDAEWKRTQQCSTTKIR